MKTTMKTTLKTHMIIWVKIKYSYFKKMSFIKIKDPRKREELIRDLIETRKRIKDNFIARKVGESEYQTGLSKLFKPITETQKATTKEITEAQKATAEKSVSELLPIKEGLEKFTSGLIPIEEGIKEPSAKPALETFKKEKNLGSLALKALENLGSETTFGLTFKGGDFRMGDKIVNIKDNNIIVDDVEYEGTPGLWNLIMLKEPQNFTEEDYENYRDLLMQTNAIYQNNDPNQNKPKSNKSNKWKKLISPIWEHIKEKKEKEEAEEDEEYEEYEDLQPSTSGTGLTILPNDPNALIERFDLLLSSQNAGHTGVRNELVSILDFLKRQGVINTYVYKKLNFIIKK